MIQTWLEQQQGLRGLIPILKETIMHKILSKALHATEKHFIIGRVCRSDKLHCCLILRNCHSHPRLEQQLPWSVSSHQHRSKIIHWGKKYDSLKAQMVVSTF